MTEAASVRNELEKSRRDVLDLSLRNPLLNFRPSKRRGLEVVDELSRELFQILVRAERVMYFLPAPEGKGPAGVGAAGQGAAGQGAATEYANETDETPSDVPAELLALLAEPAEDPTEPPPATPTTSSRPRSPSPASTSVSARASGRPASRSRSRASTSSTSPWGCSGGTSPTAAPPNVARR